MEQWTVEFWAEKDGKAQVEEWLDSLNTDQLKAISKEILLLSKCGNTLRLPHSKALDDGLFELREMRFGFRVYYTFNKGRIILLLCAGDKKTQARDIKTARLRIANIRQQETKK